MCRVLLQHMAPEHKFETAARLCKDVITAFCEGNLSLTEAPEVLRDALHILASPDLKVCPCLWRYASLHSTSWLHVPILGITVCEDSHRFPSM